MVNSIKFNWGLKSKRKLGKKRKKTDIWKRKFRRITKNFGIWQEKIHWIQIEITRRAVEFNGEFNQIQLRIEIEAKIGEKTKENRHLEDKIQKSYKKFDNFWIENSLNSNLNDSEKCRIERYSIEDSHRTENRRKKETKKTFGRQNLSKWQKIWQEKIHWIRIEMTRRAAEFKGEFNQIRLKIQIEMKMRERKPTFAKKFPRENLRKENSLNSNLKKMQNLMKFEVKMT